MIVRFSYFASSRTRRWSRLILLTALFASLALLASSTTPVASAQFQTVPVERLLNPDGTLNLSAGRSGALDLRGWNVMLHSLRGPILTRRRGASESLPQQARDPHPRSGTLARAVLLAPTWEALPHNGLNQQVYALAVIGSDLYLGGTFTQTFDGAVTNLNGIAKFSGGAWAALPNSGLNGEVYALAVSGSDLYVGGAFNATRYGTVTLNSIAKFSGGAWSALPNKGLNSIVVALAVNGSDLYAGGLFTQTADGAVTLNGIAKSSGGAWSALPNNGFGGNGSAYALAVSGSDLYVGGSFTRTFDDAVTNLNNIAKFSGGAWSALPHNGLNGTVYALAVSGSDLYVGGDFSQTADFLGGNMVGIAKFSGGAWSALPDSGLTDPALAFAVSGSDLYVGGLFWGSRDGAVTLNGIAKFSGGAWSALPHNGLNWVVQALAVSGSDLYVGGFFNQTFDGAVTNLNFIAKLSPTYFKVYLPLVSK